VVAGDVEEGDVEPADDVLEVLEGQVAGRENQVGTEAPQLRAVERFVDLIGDCQDPRHLNRLAFLLTGMSAFDLNGRVAIVTGGNGGIGLAMAKGLAEAGAKVLIAGRSVEKNERAVDEIVAGGGQAGSMAADVLEEASGARLVGEAVSWYGRLDILVNNAGINIRKRPEEYTLAEWHAVLDSNLTSAFLCAKAAHPELKKNGGGKVINIGSMTSLLGGSHLAPYAASKGGVLQLTRSLAVAWGP